MRVQDIQVGTRCYTKVSERRVLVEVIQDRGGNGRRYLVKRCDNGAVLAGKLRAASALHASGEGEWTGAFAPAETARNGCGCRRCSGLEQGPCFCTHEGRCPGAIATVTA
jgi:hypothetical protein